MEYNTTSFMLNLAAPSANRTATTTTVTFNNVNMKSLLGELYDKYDMYALHLDTWIGDSAISFNNYNAGVVFKMKGLKARNNYDNSPLCLEDEVTLQIPYLSKYYTPFTGINGSILIEKPREFETLQFYYTDFSGNKLAYQFPSLLMTFTGIDNIPRIRKYDINIKSVKLNFLLSPMNSIDPNTLTLTGNKNRVWSFKIDLKNLLGSFYNKYNRFALVTKKVTGVVWNGSSYTTQQTSRGGLLLISGLDFVTNGFMFNPTHSGFQMLYHKKRPVPLCLATNDYAGATRDFSSLEASTIIYPMCMNITNVFEKTDANELIITNHASLQVSPTTSSDLVVPFTNSFPIQYVECEIFPIIDDHNKQMVEKGLRQNFRRDN